MQTGDVNSGVQALSVDASSGALTLLSAFSLPYVQQAGYERTAFSAFPYPAWGPQAVALVQVRV